MKKKLISLLSALLITTVALTGCGGSSTESSQTTDSTQTTTDDTQTTTDSQAKTRLDKIKEAGVIVMATSPDFAPYEFENISGDGETYVGSDIELGKFIAQELGVELKIEAMNFSAVQTAISTGTVDMAIAGFAYTEERAMTMELSDFYNLTLSEGQGLLVAEDAVEDFQTAEDFTGKIVAAQNGSLQYGLVTEYLPNATLEPITNLKDAMLMLQSGKVDAVAVDASNGAMFAENYGGIALCGFYFDYSSEGNVLAVPKGETELIAEINKAIAKVNEQELYGQWVDEATELARSLGVEVNE